MSWKLTKSTNPVSPPPTPPSIPPLDLCPHADLPLPLSEFKETTLGTLSSSASSLPTGSSSGNTATKQSSGTITSPSQAVALPSTDKTASSSSLPAAAAAAAQHSSADLVSATSDSTLKPGRLTVQIFEAKGLTLPPGVSRHPERPPSSSVASVTRGHDRSKPSRSHLALPYIVLEFDKNQVVLETNYGELSAPVWGRVQDLYILYLSDSFDFPV
jgi:hypothetical protein